MREVITLGAITIVITAFVVVSFNGAIEKVSRPLDLVTNFRQIDKPKRCAVFLNQVLK